MIKHAAICFFFFRNLDLLFWYQRFYLTNVAKDLDLLLETHSFQYITIFVITSYLGCIALARFNSFFLYKYDVYTKVAIIDEHCVLLFVKLMVKQEQLSHVNFRWPWNGIH